ncbi:MAG: fumarylacetoacetate hydrolase family protein [Pseudomonadota bacterium]|nr:fumarylacetoacetate hydrolase family protein [Pseudomonadota bacterium]
MSTVLGIDIEAVALEMKSAQDRVAQVLPFTGRLPGFDVAAGYAVAHRVHQARLAEGAHGVGRKIGFTNPGLWAQYGVRTPIWGHMYDRSVVRLVGTEGRLSLGRLADPKIEPEIVFGFRTVPHAGATLAAIAEAIEWVAHGFEIVQSHFPGWKFAAADTVADGGLHGALVIGPVKPFAVLGADPFATLESLAVELSCDGRTVDTGVGANVLGSPLKALAHLLAVLAESPARAPLRAGEIVTTGTITLAHPIRAGETWRSRIRGADLPELTVTFEA